MVKTTRDGPLAEFASDVDAVRCAVAFLGGMQQRNPDTPEDRRMEFCIGVNPVAEASEASKECERPGSDFKGTWRDLWSFWPLEQIDNIADGLREAGLSE